MIRHLLRALMITLLVNACAPRTACANLLYSFNNYDSVQNGWKLIGHIEVVPTAPDNSLLELAEIVSLSLTVAHPTLTPHNGLEFNENDIERLVAVHIDNQHIFINFDFSSSFQESDNLISILRSSQLFLARDFIEGGVFTQDTVHWFARRFGPEAGSDKQTIFTSTDNTPAFPNPWGLVSGGTPLGDPFIIATAVPEPSSLLIAIIGCGALHVFPFGLRKRLDRRGWGPRLSPGRASNGDAV